MEEKSLQTNFSNSKFYDDNVYIQSLSYTIFLSLTNRASFRSLITSSEATWAQATTSLVRLACKMTSQSESLLQAILSLFINISSAKTGPVTHHSPQLIQISLKFLDISPDLVLKLVGNLLQSGPVKAENFAHLDKNFIHKLVDRIQSEHSCIDQCLKVLALCTGFRPAYCEMLPGVGLLYRLFEGVSQSVSDGGGVNLKRLNEKRINNGVLVMSNCVGASSGFGEELIESNIVMDLLYLARDGLNKEMQKNCGILIARLCKSNER